MKPLKHFNLDKPAFDLKINWAMILAFVTFWSYGYYGAMSPKALSILTHIVISLILYVIFLLFIFLGHRRPEYRDSLTIRKKDIFVFLSYFVIMFSLSLKDLLIPVSSDQLCHSWYAQVHAIQLILIIHKKIPNILGNFVFSNILHLFNIMILVSIIIIYFIFRKTKFFIKAIFLSLLFISFRIIIIKFWGAYDMHPPFRLFPLWLSSSIFSSANLSFRLPQFLGMTSLMWLAQKIAENKLAFLKSWLLGLTIGTIPLLWHTATLAEQSIWTAVIWTLLLLTISKYETLDNFNWIRWFSLISIFTLMRQTAFLGLIHLFLLFFVNNLKVKKFVSKRVLLVLAPILAIAPFLLRNFIFFSVYYDIQKNTSGIQRVLMALISGTAPNLILHTVTLPWLIFLPFAFIISPFKANKLIKTLAALLFFFTAFYVFYSMGPTLWVFGRHKAEYILPFVILGFYHSLVKLNEINKTAIRLLTVAGIILLLFFNLYTFKNLYKFKRTYILSSQDIYNYDEALMAVREEGYGGSLVIVGATFGALPQIINKFKISEVSSGFDIYKQVVKPGAEVEIQALNSNKKIKLVLISDMLVESREKLISYLLSSGWKTWRDFRNPESGFVIYGFIRK